MTPGDLASWLALLLAGFGIAYLAIAAVSVLAFARRRPPAAAPDAAAAVTVLRPLHGTEPGLYANLASSLRQDYPAPVQLVLGVQNAADPALAIARQLKDDHPDHDIEIVVDATMHGENRKVSNLINMAARAKHGLVVLADSDMRVAPDYLSRLAAELAVPGVGIVTCPYHGMPTGSAWSRLGALWIAAYFLPGVVLGAMYRLANPCMGSTIALRRETLDQIGGFAALADDLADDYELGRRVRALGLKLVVTPFTVGHVCADDTAGALVAQELRWSRTTRQIAPGGYLGSVVTHPVAFAALALLLDPDAATLAVLAIAIAMRAALCLAAERAFGLKAHAYWLIPARDLLAFGVFVASFFGRRVTWRGQRYAVARSGALLSETRI